MTTPWKLTIDCRDVNVMMTFWKAAIGYVEAPPPEGWDSWDQWLRDLDVPEDEWDDGGALVDPTGRLPGIGFLKVPEPKTAKNRLHLDVQVSGGRQVDQSVRERRISAEVSRLVTAGARVEQEHRGLGGLGGPGGPGGLDHVVLSDPEGNEFCVV